ncbi:LacI family DNA-binding transcriptional regulator [Rheinheimera sp. EpRS3]|uniref:LacI family DNA-binding transcriptional regulator n=1 Tax=Rheinheimera sp. EpRS3 TaxID=1712383 RepID=UPI00074A2C23|nr:LacI family DNA-binding transcriptional regulator [Rheinheimera sp. EpRS3]KUM52038.1 LacI family transcriptional regulator [Rheinheimera sp. EpRS3]
MATIYQVSELAGVSLATVSRVMNNNARVSEATRNKVLAAMEQLGYRPNSIAQSLASNRSNSVGILVSELHGPFYGEMLSGIENECRAAGKHVIIAAGHSEEASEKDGIEFLISRSCDALILHVEAVSDDYLIKLASGNMPIVLINRFIPRLANNCISLDNELGGYLATKQLLQQGHTQLAYMAGPMWKSDAKDRYHGHLRAMAEHGLSFNPALLAEGDFQDSSGSACMQQLLAKGLPFSALVCANDEMAAGAMEVARAHGLNVPQDLSIVGFDNLILARYIYPKLTTIDYPIGEMGRMAARWVLKNIYQQQALQLKNVFEPVLVCRDSASAIAAG